MKRRNAMGILGVLSGHAMFPLILTGFASSCAKKEETGFKPGFFKPDEMLELKRIIDFIIPQTSTGSASQSKVEEFIDEILSNCLSDERKESLRKRISLFIEEWSTQTDYLEFLKEQDKQSFKNEDYEHFRVIKQLTLIGYFTSKEGITKASDYQKVPGEYIGEIEMTDETLNIANTSMHFNI